MLSASPIGISDDSPRFDDRVEVARDRDPSIWRIIITEITTVAPAYRTRKAVTLSSSLAEA